MIRKIEILVGLRHPYLIHFVEALPPLKHPINHLDLMSRWRTVKSIEVPALCDVTKKMQDWIHFNKLPG